MILEIFSLPKQITTRIVYNKGLPFNSLFTFSIFNNGNPDGDITRTYLRSSFCQIDNKSLTINPFLYTIFVVICGSIKT